MYRLIFALILIILIAVGINALAMTLDTMRVVVFKGGEIHYEGGRLIGVRFNGGAFHIEGNSFWVTGDALRAMEDAKE